MAVIYFFSAQPVLPGFELVWQDFLFKKLAHFSVYALLFLTWWWAFREMELSRSGTKASAPQIIRYKWLLIMIFCFIYACLDEYHQSFTPGRTARLYDVGIDMLGSLTALLFVYRLLDIKKT
jgi:VanZ family protein